MRVRPLVSRAVTFAVAAVAAAGFVSWTPSPVASAAGAPLTSAEVSDLVARCVSFARCAKGKPQLAVAVVDVEGNSLGVFRMSGLSTDPAVADNAVATARTCWTDGADSQLPLPPWLAVMVVVPGATTVTRPALVTVATPGAELV